VRISSRRTYLSDDARDRGIAEEERQLGGGGVCSGVTEEPEPPETVLTCEAVAQQLRREGVIDPALTECVALAGGAASRVAALSRPGGTPEVVVKLNAPDEVRAETAFLRTYAASPLLPGLRYVDPTGEFLVCDFVDGIRIRYGEDRVDTRAVMLRLVGDLLAHYVSAEPSAEAMPWTTFLGDHVSYRHAALAEFVSEEDRALVERLARDPRREEAAPHCLIHGDCGAHNFLFERRGEGIGGLIAMIDPYPLIGYSIYDLAFAFVSWPNGLEPETILPAAEALKASGRWRPNGDMHRVVCEEVLIALYMRMGTCLVYHPNDLPA